ncbi:MmgE/PrpD family protein 4 [Actinomadura spongiicola]|uniref:MmgE/PrpD family protein 4 n=1 Tax=Actinomadura spongiicola TaxID=2303421 RepID=A0A372GMF7_9ACTN|nr:MmgE/PrpD family protein [Actinomadura spongiicola]RFS86576.1 MmgE/PrpD family protein 4 [Actinomadura spongiicola]
MTLAEHVAEFTAGLTLAAVPSDVVEKAKVTLLHDLGVGLAGHRLADTGFAFAKEHGACDPARGARLPIDGTAVTVESCALATGALIHARTQDDTQVSVSTHLGSTTLPALLALADRADAHGRDLLTAMIAGYEAASVIAEGHAGPSTARGFRATGVYGPLAAAAGSARLLGLDTAQTVSALGLAAAFGGGTNQTWLAGTQEWRYQVGAASRNGMVAALLAARGVTGAPDSLDGAAGHLRAFSGVPTAPDPGTLRLGDDWRIRRVTYKPYPVCAINQVPVTVLIELARRHGLKQDDVASVTVTLAPDDAAYPGIDAHGPFRDVGGTLMSLPYCLATALRHGGIALDDLFAFDDPALMDLTRRITVTAAEDVPQGGCRVAVQTRDGVRTAAFAPDATTFNWDRAETADRLRALVADTPLSPARLDGFIAVALDLDNRPVRELIDATIVHPKE